MTKSLSKDAPKHTRDVLGKKKSGGACPWTSLPLICLVEHRSDYAIDVHAIMCWCTDIMYV
jgi:hypothetical protein